jgi:hypothetical protein
MELEAPVHGENVESAPETSVATRADDEVCPPFLGDAWGKDQDLLQDLLANTVVELLVSRALFIGVSEPEDAGATRDRGKGETGTADTARAALLASGPAVLVVVPTAMTPSAKLHAKR